MSAYKEKLLDKALAVITLPAGITLMPVPDVDLESVALTIFAVLACLGVLLVLRSGWLVNVLMTKGTVLWVVAASALLGAVLSKGEWLPSALAWSFLSAGAWLALLLSLVVCRAVAWIVLWPVVWLARRFIFESDPVQRGSYASPSPRRSTVSAPRRHTAPAGAGYAAAGAATGYAAEQVWGDMSDPLDSMNPLNPLSPAAQLAHQEPQRMFPLVNTNGILMSSDTGVDDLGHSYGDPAPIFEPAPVYDYTPACDYSNSNCGGGFDF